MSKRMNPLGDLSGSIREAIKDFEGKQSDLVCRDDLEYWATLAEDLEDEVRHFSANDEDSTIISESERHVLRQVARRLTR